MRIDVIDNIQQFDKLKKSWDDVYVADINATVFVSWAWIRGWIETTSGEWLVLAIRHDDSISYVAFLALGVKTSARGIFMGGNPMSDHTGFVCLPEHEKKAVEAFAIYIQKNLKWDIFNMKDVFDHRLNLFLKYFPHTKFSINKNDSTTCPYISLPDSWEKYVEDFLSTRTKKNLLYYTRRIECATEFHVTQVNFENLENQIETFLKLFQMRWGSMHENKLNCYRWLFQNCFKSNYLWLDILWDGVKPIAAMASFIDRSKKTFSYYNAGYNGKYDKFSPGKVMITHSIQYAIKHGFRIYDFLRGDEEYKYSFCAKERFNTNVIIERKSVRKTCKKLTNRVKRKLKRVVNF